MVNKAKIQNLVSIFYQNKFKIFYLNSRDEMTMTEPYGVFVSLGMTTSLSTLNNLVDTLNNLDEYQVKLAEISSVKLGSGGNLFLNTLLDKEPCQYRLSTDDFPVGVLDREGAISELKSLTDRLSVYQEIDELLSLAPIASKLENLIKCLDLTSGWESHRIQKESEGNYRVFHCLINYKQEDDKEFRVGIFVRKK